MTGEKTKLGITKFFGAYFRNFPKLFLTNLLFAAPLLIFSCLFYLFGRALNFNNIITLALTVIPVMPFYAGVTLVTRNMVREDKEIPVFSLFVKGVRDNGLRFLIHGVIMYFAILISYYSITVYYSLAQSNAVFYVITVFCVLIAVVFLFIFYNIPLMTVTFDLSMKNIYKNCALMSFGELKNNLLATLGVFLLGIFCLSFLVFSENSLIVIILTLIFAVFLVPASMSFIIIYAEYKGMMSLLLAKEKKKAELEKEILYKKNPALKKQEEAKQFKDDFADVVLEESDNGDEYIFHNGKMIKRSVLMEQMKEYGDSGEEEE